MLPILDYPGSLTLAIYTDDLASERLIIDLPWPEGPITPSGFGLEDLFVALLDRGWPTVEGGLLRRPTYWPYPDDQPTEDPRVFGLAAWGAPP